MEDLRSFFKNERIWYDSFVNFCKEQRDAIAFEYSRENQLRLLRECQAKRMQKGIEDAILRQKYTFKEYLGHKIYHNVYGSVCPKEYALEQKFPIILDILQKLQSPENFISNTTDLGNISNDLFQFLPNNLVKLCEDYILVYCILDNNVLWEVFFTIIAIKFGK